MCDWEEGRRTGQYGTHMMSATVFFTLIVEEMEMNQVSYVQYGIHFIMIYVGTL